MRKNYEIRTVKKLKRVAINMWKYNESLDCAPQVYTPKDSEPR